VFSAIAEQGLLGKEIEVVAVNEFVPAGNLAYLVKYDSTQSTSSSAGMTKSGATVTAPSIS
jgi:glyceraldehyde 3-phosphate dehydrogenase